MARFSKADVEFHDGHAAVNVKLYYWEWPDPAKVAADAEWGYNGGDLAAEDAEAFARRWREIEDGPEAQQWADCATEDGWERLQDEAQNAGYPSTARVYSEGRSGGWAVLAPDGRNEITREDVEGWDAIALARWARFVKYVGQTCDDLPYQAVSLYYINSWVPERKALETRRRFSFYDAPAGVGA